MQKLCDDDFSHRMASEKFPDSGANCSAKFSVLHRCNHRFIFFPFTNNTDFFYEFFEPSLIERALCKMKGFFLSLFFWLCSTVSFCLDLLRTTIVEGVSEGDSFLLHFEVHSSVCPGKLRGGKCAGKRFHIVWSERSRPKVGGGWAVGKSAFGISRKLSNFPEFSSSECFTQFSCCRRAG